MDTTESNTQQNSKDYTLTYYEPDLSMVKTKPMEGIQTEKKTLKNTIILPGNHTSQSCALNASIYDSNTKFQEKIHIDSGKITKKVGLHFTIVFTDKKTQTGVLAYTNGINTASFTATSIIQKITWKGYFQPEMKGTYRFNKSENIKIFMGPTAFIASDNEITSFTIDSLSEASIPIRIVFTNNSNTVNTKYKLVITDPNDKDIKSSTLFSLFNGCNFYHRSPTLYFLEKKDEKYDVDDNFQCSIVGKINTKNPYNPSIKRTPTSIKNQPLYVNVCNKVRAGKDRWGRTKHRTKCTNIPRTGDSAKAQSVSITPTEINAKDNIKYSRNKDFIFLNTVEGNPSIGQYSITNNKSENKETYFIPSNSNVFDYANSKTFEKVMGNVYPVSFGRSYDNKNAKQCAKLVPKNVNTIYIGNDPKDKKEHCYAVTPQSLTFLPAFQNQPSTAYKKIPNIRNLSDKKYNVTTGVNSVKNINFSNIPIYKESTIPEPAIIEKAKNFAIAASNKLTSISNSFEPMSNYVLEGLTPITSATIIAQGNIPMCPSEEAIKENPNIIIPNNCPKKYSANSTIVGTEGTETVNQNSATVPSDDNLFNRGGSSGVVYFHKLDTTTDTANVYIPSLIKTITNDVTMNVAQVRMKHASINFTNKTVEEIFKKFTSDNKLPIVFQIQVRAVLTTKKATGTFNIFDLRSTDEYITITIESYNATLVNIKANVKVKSNKKPFTFVGAIPKCCRGQGNLLTVDVKLETKLLTVRVNSQPPSILLNINASPNLSKFNKITIGATTMKMGNTLSSLNSIKGSKMSVENSLLVAAVVVAQIPFFPLAYPLAIIAGAMKLNSVIKARNARKRERRRQYPDSLQFSNFKIHADKKKESFSNINIDYMALPYSSIKESFTTISNPYKFKEGITGLNPTASVDLLTINSLETELRKYNSINTNYQKIIDQTYSNLSDASGTFSTYRDLVKRQRDSTIDGGGVLYKVDNGQIVPKVTNHTAEVVKDDLNKLIIQQNTIYITGTVACATLLIAAIMIGSK